MYLKHGYTAVSVLALVSAVVLVYAYAEAEYVRAWFAALVIVLCMEGRVQMLGRLPRTPLFWVHLAAAVPSLLVLTCIAFWYREPWLVGLEGVLLVIVLATASVLWYRGLVYIHTPRV